MELHVVIAELRKLNRPVPIPIRLPDENDIEQIERELEVTFHSDYRTFLLEASDVVYGALEPATVTNPNSHTYLPKICTSAWAMGVSKELLPICEDNGNYYCMSSEGEIIYWAHDGWSDEKWKDLATWIQKVWIEEQEDYE